MGNNGGCEGGEVGGELGARGGRVGDEFGEEFDPDLERFLYDEWDELLDEEGVEERAFGFAVEEFQHGLEDFRDDLTVFILVDRYF